MKAMFAPGLGRTAPGNCGMVLGSDQGDATMVPVVALRDADSPRSSGEDAAHIRLLAESADWPPITVHRSTMRVIDGMHRLRAARLRGQAEIAARFFDGTDAEAFALAVRLNASHGLPLSLPDRKAAAARILTSHPQWSDRLTASVAGLAAKTVAEIRRQAKGGPGRRAGTAPETEVRIGQDGRVRRLSSAEGRRKAAELMQEQPSLSLRQVARAAGISPETVRDVRKRLSAQTPQPRPGTERKVGPASAAKRNTRPARAAVPAKGPDFRIMLRRLKADPSLRLTRTGRTLLKLLYAHAKSEEELAGVVDIVPASSQKMIAQAALECAAAWWSFADRIEQPADQEPENGDLS